MPSVKAVEERKNKFNPEFMDKAQVLVRIENIGRVKALKEQDVPTIQQCFPPENGNHSITVILNEGDLKIQSSSRQESALEQKWTELLRPELCGGGNSIF